MKTKKEVIKEAWGEYYDIVKDVINENGFYDFFDLDCTERKRKLWQFENITMTQSKEGHYIRPKSLQGIENNNGWVKIESEDDLPKYFIECYFITKYSENTIVGGFFSSSDKKFYNHNHYYNIDEITHYQPIVKPKKPIY